jgi:hypothetical protein
VRGLHQLAGALTMVQRIHRCPGLCRRGSLQGKRTEPRPTNTSITKRGQVVFHMKQFLFEFVFCKPVSHQLLPNRSVTLASREAEQVKLDRRHSGLRSLARYLETVYKLVQHRSTYSRYKNLRTGNWMRSFKKEQLPLLSHTISNSCILRHHEYDSLGSSK